MSNVEPKQALPVNTEEEGVYEVSWTGMDGIHYVDEIPSLKGAIAHATFNEERGAHCISITGPDGEEVDF